ncbi:hypothetical protein E3N88_31594 [Mikania micrantha]|uniref:Integrase catalytic domain-containing protein n=1 Tax=Mikania micrantha TaxID=192012 RepID=A0A5N6M5Z9_9ASTR|nr:hypothetical protein E3N88_31594 [Mikania micrantha]
MSVVNPAAAPKEASSVSLQILTLTATNYTTWSIKMEEIMDVKVCGKPLRHRRVSGSRQGAEGYEALRMKDGETIDEYPGKLSRMMSKHSSLGVTLADSTVVRKFLDTIPDKYLQLVASIEQTTDLDTMSFDEAIGRLKAYEDRLKSWQMALSGESSLLLTKADGQTESKPEKRFSSRGRGRDGFHDRGGRSSSRGRGSYRGRGGRGSSFGHQDFYYNRKPRDRKDVWCYKCNQMGHYATECSSEKKAGDEVHLTQKEADELTLLLSVHGEDTPTMVLLNEENVIPGRVSAACEGDHNVWYLDNGASNHMTGLKDVFAEIDEQVSGQVKFGDGLKVPIRRKGSMLFECKNGDQLLIQDVYYIHALSSNIMSLGQLTERGYEVSMRDSYLKLVDERGRLVLKVSRGNNRLFKVSLKASQPVSLMVKLENEAWLWHARLGHANFNSIGSLAVKDLVQGVPKISHQNQLCEDLCGPINPPTLGGNSYFLLIVDDYCRFMWVYLLKTKSEAFEAFRRFKLQVEKESSYVLKATRTDRGGEFNSDQFRDFCLQNGIHRQLTAPYSPQQNKVVKRCNKTVMEMTRSMLKAMKMPDYLWGEAVRHSVYLLNRITTKALKDMTPYQDWKGRKPNLGHLKVFSSVAHVKVPSHKVTKLDDRSVMMVYLGVEEGSKAHRFLNPKDKKIVVSRDAVFDEGKNWDWNVNQMAQQSVTRSDTYIHFEKDNTNEEYEAPLTPMSVSHDEQIHVTPLNHGVLSPATPTPLARASSSHESIYDQTHNDASSSDSRIDHTPVRGFSSIQELYDRTTLSRINQILPKNSFIHCHPPPILFAVIGIFFKQ